jgi:Na+-driven multidrug efflux pump
MGISGIALATILGQLLSTILALVYLLKRFKSVSLVFADLRLRLGTIGSICSLGIAPFATHILMTIVQIVQLDTLRFYGALSIYGSEIPIAVTGALFKVMMVLLACVIGISLGCQPIYGFNYGAKKYDRVKKAYMLAIRYGTTVSVIAFILLQLFPRQILGIFGSGNPLFFDYGTRYIRIYLIMTFANAIQPVSSTFFTSTGKANLSFWAAVLRQGILLIPLVLVLPIFWGIDGFFWAGPISDFGAVIIVIFMASREVKKLTKLQIEQEGMTAG